MKSNDGSPLRLTWHASYPCSRNLSWHQWLDEWTPHPCQSTQAGSHDLSHDLPWLQYMYSLGCGCQSYQRSSPQKLRLHEALFPPTIRESACMCVHMQACACMWDREYWSSTCFLLTCSSCNLCSVLMWLNSSLRTNWIATETNNLVKGLHITSYRATFNNQPTGSFSTINNVLKKP